MYPKLIDINKTALLLGVNSKITQSNLALAYLKAVATVEAPHWKIKILEVSINQAYEEMLNTIMSDEYGVIGISCYIWNIDLVRKLSEDIRILRPYTRLVLGGHEVSHDPRVYLDEGLCDFVITGEGEFKFAALLNALTEEEFKPNQLIDTWFAGKNEATCPSKSVDIEPLDSIPSPFEIEDHWLDSKSFTYYESSRGCVYKCHFCLSALDRGSRFFSMDRFYSDMSTILAKQNIRQVKFVDRTFNLNEKRSNQIFEFLLEHGVGRNFHFEVQAELFKPSTLKILEQAPEGMFQFEVGIQSTNQQVLDQNGRKCKLEKLLKNVRLLRRKTKIHLHLDLIAGLADETPEQFINSFNRVILERPHHLQIEVIKLLKGSIARKLAPLKGMQFQKSAPYTLLKSKDWSYEDLSKVQRVSAILELYFNRDKIRACTESALQTFENPWLFFLELADFVAQRHPSRTGIPLRKAFDFLYDFMVERDLLNESFLRSFSLDFLREFPFNGKLPFPKVSQTLPRQQYLEIARKLNLNIKGFIEVFQEKKEPLLVYFPGKTEKAYLPLKELLGPQSYKYCLDIMQTDDRLP